MSSALGWLLLFGATIQVFGSTPDRAVPAGFSGFRADRKFPECVGWLQLSNGVRIQINTPPLNSFGNEKKVLLVFYALPNGNTIEQTVGKAVKPDDDWHFDIQHIGAQTRFVRELIPERTIVVAYLENDLKSWPAWRRKFGDAPIPAILDMVKQCLPMKPSEMVLSGHSGGGSLIFGYLNTLNRIPAEIVRIAFLDSNYAYDTARHKDKLVEWLRASDQHFLCVLAYDDASALLDGKPFVSASGGTWGRSHQMRLDLSGEFQFNGVTNAGFQRFSALDGRLQFILKENPDRKIFHTVQVEKNGFIHSMVSGTPRENNGYEYFGERAYSRFISPGE